MPAARHGLDRTESLDELQQRIIRELELQLAEAEAQVPRCQEEARAAEDDRARCAGQGLPEEMLERFSALAEMARLTAEDAMARAACIRQQLELVRARERVSLRVPSMTPEGQARNARLHELARRVRSYRPSGGRPIAVSARAVPLPRRPGCGGRPKARSRRVGGRRVTATRAGPDDGGGDPEPGRARPSDHTYLIQAVLRPLPKGGGGRDWTAIR